MVHRAWKHRCAESQDIEVLYAIETCFWCGRKGVRDGWDYSTLEKMYMYQRVTGVPSIGGHRKYMDRIHHQILGRCVECNGRGLIDVDEGENYSCCAACDGTGYEILVSEAEMRKIRLRAKAIYERREGRKFPLKIR